MTALATIHIGLKQLGIAEDDARDLYERLTGERSLRAMGPDQHQALIDELKRLGFKPASKGSQKRLAGKYAPILQALWIGAWNLGVVPKEDNATLLGFVKRQTRIDHTRFLHYHDDATKAIEAIKARMARDGGVDWSKRKNLPDWTQANGYRIAKAQHRKLAAAGLVNASELDVWLIDNGFARAPRMTGRSWISAMNKMGALIRAHQR